MSSMVKPKPTSRASSIAAKYSRTRRLAWFSRAARNRLRKLYPGFGSTADAIDSTADAMMPAARRASVLMITSNVLCRGR
jgi:hypothetical protein